MSYPGQGYRSYGGRSSRSDSQHGRYGPPQQAPPWFQGYPPPQSPGGYPPRPPGPPGPPGGYPPPQGYSPNYPSYPPQQHQGYQHHSQGYSQHSQGYPQEQNRHNYDSYGPPSGAPPKPTHQAINFSSKVDNYSYQYSECTGKRKALLIGINYTGTKNELKGCINDVHNVSNFLQTKYNYKKDDMVILTDGGDSRSSPTKENIIKGCKWLVNNAQPDDSLFFHYSGHGGQVADQDGDEDDGFDECIYPLDFETNGEIIDDTLHLLLVSPLQAGVRLTALFDSCHSGTVLDLPYIYSTKGIVKEPNLLQEAGEGLLSAVTNYASGNYSGILNDVTSLFTKVSIGDSAADKTKQTKTHPADVILISGCKDDQTSADSKENGVSTGAMSYAFLHVMNENNNLSYLELLKNMRKLMKAKYKQKPQLSCCHPIDVNLRFIM